MELRRIKLSEELKEARKTLFDISFINDMDEDFVGTSHAYAVLEGWLLNWTPTFEKVYSFLSGSVNIGYSIRNELQGYRQERDPEIFNEIRPILVGFIDLGLNKVDQKCEVRPLLEEYIERVQDAKLAELLKEFNAVKN